MKIAGLGVVAALLSIALSGCTGGIPAGDEAVEAPDFEGPWAAEFASAYEEATSQDARDALEDGEITELEFAEMEQRYGECLEAAGIEFGGFNDDFSHGFNFPDHMTYEDADALLNECSEQTGERQISSLYSSIAQNPQNVNPGELQVACLIEKGLVSPDYTVEQWEQDVPNHSYPIIESPTSEKDVAACESDPLGASVGP